MLKVTVVFLLWLSSSSAFATAGAEQALFENAVRFNLPTGNVVSVCEGISYGTANATYYCGKITSEAEIQTRAVCDGIFGGIQRGNQCASIRYADNQKALEKTAQDICNGLYWGVQSQLQCDQLAAPGETDVAKLKAKETCLGIYWGTKSWKSCVGLGSRVQVLCESVRRWNPNNSFCKK